MIFTIFHATAKNLSWGVFYSICILQLGEIMYTDVQIVYTTTNLNVFEISGASGNDST